MLIFFAGLLQIASLGTSAEEVFNELPVGLLLVLGLRELDHVYTDCLHEFRILSQLISDFFCCILRRFVQDLVLVLLDLQHFVDEAFFLVEVL